MKKDKSDKTPRGRLLIRNYVYSLRTKHGGENYRLPSSRVMAEQFSLSRSTVTRELEQLIEEGALITRHGIGTFLAPVQLGGEPDSNPVFGVIYCAGNNYHYDQFAWRLISATGNALIDLECFVRPITILSKQDMLHELQENFLDGLIWLNPYEDHLPVLRKISSELPTVSFGLQQIKECNSVYIDNVQESYLLGKQLLAEGRRSFWCALGPGGGNSYLDGYRQAWREEKIPFDDSKIFNAALFVPDDIRRLLAAGERPQAFYIHTSLRSGIVQLLQEFGVDFRHECRLISDIDAAQIPGFAGWCHEQPYAEVGKTLASIGMRLLGGDRRIDHIKLKTKSITINLDSNE